MLNTNNYSELFKRGKGVPKRDIIHYYCLLPLLVAKKIEDIKGNNYIFHLL